MCVVARDDRARTRALRAVVARAAARQRQQRARAAYPSSVAYRPSPFRRPTYYQFAAKEFRSEAVPTFSNGAIYSTAGSDRQVTIFSR